MSTIRGFLRELRRRVWPFVSRRELERTHRDHREMIATLQRIYAEKHERVVAVELDPPGSKPADRLFG